MRRLLVVSVFLFSWFLVCSQVTPSYDIRIADATTAFGVNVSIGSTVYNVNDNYIYVCITASASTLTLTTGSANFIKLSKYSDVYWTLNGSDLYPNSTSYYVGIGTSNPAYNLDVTGNVNVDGGMITLDDYQAIGWNLGLSALIQTHNSTKDLLFSTNGSERMRITNSDGNVGIGTSSPTGKLDVEVTSWGNSGVYPFQFTNTDATATEGYGMYIQGGDASTEHVLTVEDLSGNTLFDISGDGNVGIGTNDPQALVHSVYDGTHYIYERSMNSIGAATNRFIKSRGTTSTKLAVEVGDYLGSFQFWGYYDATNSTYGAIYGSMVDKVDGTSVAASHVFLSRDTASFAYAERMRLTASGFLGIGTTAPTEKLEVDGNVKGDTAKFIDVVVTGTVYGSLVTKSYGFTSQGIGAGTYYAAGYYDYSTTDANLTQSSTTVTLGTANGSYAAHAIAVSGGSGGEDTGSDLVLTVTGTSITDAGVRTAADSEVIVATCLESSVNTYYETSKKWIGQITYTLSSDAASTFNYDFNYAFAKYEDFGNHGFQVKGFEAVGLAAATDANFNITLFHHCKSDWNYAATGFEPTPTEIVDLQTVHNTEYSTINNYPFAFKRTPLTTSVDGSGSEGVIIRIVTGQNNTVQAMDMHIGVVFER